MSQIVIAEYDEKSRTLHFAEPLVGVEDHAFVEIVVRQRQANRVADQPTPSVVPWAHLKGSITDPTFFEAIDEMFPPSDDDSDRR
jgi:hypothetical protein